jgi:pimeloyl-ACP methyl ester carboxylesterase
VSYPDSLSSDERHKVLQHQLWPGDSQVLYLPWGGIISYARFGRAREEGPMIVGEHGTPGCRYCPQHLHTYAERHRIRLLWIDRPGYGHSTLRKGRSIEDHTKDVEYLLDFLDVQEFTQIGFSGGGPYVLAAAKFFPPTRLRKSVIMCGATHPDYEQTSVRVYWRFKRMIVRYIPFAVKFLYKYSLNYHLKKSIKAANGNKELIKRAYFVRIETFRQDLAGYRNDFKLLGRDWGFKLEDINSGPIRWYHGSLDTNTSSSAARLTAKLVNNKRGNLEYREYAGLDHFSLQTEKYKEAMDWLQKRE